MKKISFALVGAAALALAACGGKHDEDAAGNTDANMDHSAMDMNAMDTNAMAAPVVEETNTAAAPAINTTASESEPVDDSDSNAAEVTAM